MKVSTCKAVSIHVLFILSDMEYPSGYKFVYQTAHMHSSCLLTWLAKIFENSCFSSFFMFCNKKPQK